MDTIFPTIGAAVAVAGGDKLTGDRAYEGMFRDLGWSRGTMRAAGAVELLGGLLMGPRATRRLGAAMLVAVSVPLLVSEMRHGDAKLAAPRALILLAALTALLAPLPAKAGARPRRLLPRVNA
jgi:hypothetical protein